MPHEAQCAHDDYRLQETVHKHVFEKKNTGVALEILFKESFGRTNRKHSTRNLRAGR